MEGTEHVSYRLDDLLVDIGARRVWRGSEEIELPKLSFDLLTALLDAYPNAVSIDELMARVWGRTVVNASTVAKRVQLLRKTLGDDRDESHYITLVRGHGYRLSAGPVPCADDSPATSPALSPALSPPPAPAAQKGPRARGLTWLVPAAAVGAAVLLFLAFAVDQIRAPVRDDIPDRSVAVLPFQSLSGEPEDELFADGLTEEISHVLATHPDLKVTGRTSAFYYKGRNEDLREVGRTLGVAHVLEGAVRREGDQLRITAQLIETESGFHRWSQAYDRPLSKLVEIQQDIAHNVAASFRASLALDAPQTGHRPSPESQATFLVASQLFREDVTAAQDRLPQILEELLRAEPEYAQAWVLLAEFHARMLLTNREGYPYDWQEAWDQIRHAVDNALRFGPQTSAVHMLQGAEEWLYKNDAKAGARHFEQALALAPADLDVIYGLVEFSNRIGRFDVTLPLLRYLVNRDPLCASCFYRLGKTYWNMRRYDEAETTFRHFQTLTGGAQQSLGLALLYGGQPEAALSSFRELDHHLYLRLQGEVMALHDLGEVGAARDTLRRLESNWGETEPLTVAQTYAYLGDTEAAFEWLSRLDQRSRGRLRQFFLDPRFDPLRQDPRWDALLAGVGVSIARLAEIEFSPDLSAFVADAGSAPAHQR
jgi:TolB-like protein/DNA-binding winged helix-turn-helix (wHTH) protein